MKNFYIILSFFLFTVHSNAQVGIGTINVDDSAMLQIEATDKGVLLPQISLISTTDVATIVSPTTSLLVFNTNTQNDVYPGYYYWNGSKWARFITEIEPSIKCINTVTSNINDNIDAPIFGSTVWNDETLLYQVSGNNITVGRYGVYSIQVSIHFVNSKEVISPNAQLKVNGVVTGPKAASAAQETKNAGNPGGTLTIDETLILNANDEVTVQMSRGTTNSDDKDLEILNGSGTSYIVITKLN